MTILHKGARKKKLGECRKKKKDKRKNFPKSEIILE
jgi:hypothetical protein